VSCACGWVSHDPRACLSPTCLITRVGQNRIYTPYMTIYMVISLPNIPYTHRIYMVLANPTHYMSLSNVTAERLLTEEGYVHFLAVCALLTEEEDADSVAVCELSSGQFLMETYDCDSDSDSDCDIDSDCDCGSDFDNDNDSDCGL